MNLPAASRAITSSARGPTENAPQPQVMTEPRSIPPVPAVLAARLAGLANPEMVAGVAVTVARDGEAIGFWSAGYASLPFRVPVTQRTLFHIGSVGKHITALAVMQLVDAGAVALDTRLGSYVTGLP